MKKLNNIKTAIIGDLIIDVDKNLSQISTSLETPNLKGVLENVQINIGGAGNIISSFNELGCKPYLFSYLGKDYLKIIKKKLKFFDYLAVTKSNSTIKTRYWADNYKLLQVNEELIIKEKIIKNFLKKSLTIISNLNIKNLIISDYSSIFKSYEINKFFYDQFFKLKNYEQISIYVDSQFSSSFRNLNFYYSNYYFLNFREFNAVCSNLNIESNLSKETLLYIFKRLNIQNKLIIKLGKEGSLSFDGKNIYQNKLKHSYHVKNVVGAGDYFLSAYVNFSSQNENNRLRKSNKFASQKIK